MKQEKEEDKESSSIQIPFTQGIPKQQVFSTKVELDHLICPICLNILWKPVACSQDKCYSNFCEPCINRWILGLNNSEENQSEFSFDDSSDQNTIHQLSVSNGINNIQNTGLSQTLVNIYKKPCPKCNREFKRTTLPLVNTLLSSITFNCLYKGNGCQEQIPYDFFEKHLNSCNYRDTHCQGCGQYLLQKDYQQHVDNCQQIKIKCQKCDLELERQLYFQQHNQMSCLEKQIEKKDQKIKNLEDQVENFRVKMNSFEQILGKIVKGEVDQIQTFEFQTVFANNFYFGPKEVRLQQSSWNQNKNKLDFLHFYLTRGIKTQSALGVQWKIKIQVLQGSLLLGICSTLCHHSIDYIINKQGEIKKKEWNDNKYKLIRRIQFVFGEGDQLNFTYLPLQHILKIDNESKGVTSGFIDDEIRDIGDTFYFFCSMDTNGDYLKFI